MTVLGLMTDLQNTALATAIRQGDWLFPGIETIHVLGVAFTVGSIALVDTRLLGISARGYPITELSTDVLPWTWASFALAVISGALLFSSHALDYSQNAAFLVKMALLLAAGANMLAFHLLTARSIAGWDADAATPASAKAAGALSLIFWIGIVVCGRAIGFTLHPGG